MATKPTKPAASKTTPPAPAATEANAAAPGPATFRLHGSLDRVDPDGTVSGWCWSPDEPGVRRRVALLLDGAEAARFVADEERDDLARAGIGDGRHAFLFCLDPETMRPGATVGVVAVDLASGQSIGAAHKVTWAETAAPAPPVAESALPEMQGNLDRVSRDGWVSGWCWYPAHPERHVALTVWVDDAPAGSFVANHFRPDLQQAGIGDGSHGFSYALPYSALADKGALQVAVREEGSGRNVSDPITVRLGRMAGAEERIQELERQLRLLRGQIDELTRESRARDEDRAARALFGTVAAFFQELAQSPPGTAPRALGAAGMAGVLEGMLTRLPPLTLAIPAQPDTTICVAASTGVDAIHACLLALHRAGADRVADIVLLDDGAHDADAALLPAAVGNLRCLRARDLLAARNEAAAAARGEIVVFLAPEARVTDTWLEELRATFAAEPEAAVVGARLVRDDGLVAHLGLLARDDFTLHDPAHLLPADSGETRFLRRVDAVAGMAVALRRADLLAAGGFSPLFRHFGPAVAELCLRLRAAGRAVLAQPLATALWIERGAVSADALPPDLSLPDEDVLRLRERLRAEAWPQDGAAARFVGHALVIDDDLPRPDRDAGSIATWEQMQVLRRLGWRVTLCPAHAAAADPQQTELLLRHGIEVAGPPQYQSVTQYLRSEGARLDLVHVYRYANMAMLGERIRELAPGAKLVFATADLHFLREQRRAELSGGRLPETVRAEELAGMRAADATILTNDHELEVLDGLVDPAKLVLLRWIVRPRPPRTGFAERHGLCFVGTFRHPPNVDGVQWFLAEVWPLLRQRLPGVPLRLAGSDMPDALRAQCGDGVEALGWVKDLAALFDGSRLSIAPLRYGAGFKGKVATSLAHGLPVVGSGVSLEGTGLQDGDGAIRADSPEDFAAAIVRLHEDAALWQAQSARALERVAELYSPAAAEAVWRRLLARLERPARG